MYVDVYLKKMFSVINNEKINAKTKNTWVDEFDNKWVDEREYINAQKQKCYNGTCGPTTMPLDIQNKPPKTKREPPEEDDRIIALD